MNCKYLSVSVVLFNFASVKINILSILFNKHLIVMKQILFLFALIFSPFTVQATDEAEYETYRIDWSEIADLAKNQPDSIKSLMDRVAQGDTTLSDQEVLVAYMGKSYFGGLPFSESRDACSALNEDKIDSAMCLIEQAITSNPLSLSNNYYYIICVLTKNPQITDYQTMQEDESLKMAFIRFDMLLSAIYFSGNGSKEYPYKVTCIDDEYTFMSEGLELPRPLNQSLTNDGHDMFNLPAHTSTLFTGQEIHFDATRILQLETGIVF